MRRRNPDEDLRALERAALTGGPAEIARYAVGKMRAGRLGEVTLAELSYLRPESVGQAMQAIPENLRTAIRTALGETRTEPLPAMSHDEIVRTLRESGHPTWAEEWERAVLAEGWALHDYRRGRTSRSSRTRSPAPEHMAEARTNGAEHVSSFLAGSQEMTPTTIFSLRPIVAQAWATAERLREILSPTTSSSATEIESIRVWAEAHSDDGQINIPFDATPWFEQATDDQIVALAEIGWGGGDEADDVARFFSDSATAPLFGSRAQRRRGFECNVNHDEAVAWLRAHRPGLVCELCRANAAEPTESGRRICRECLAPFRCVRCGGQAIPEMRGSHLISRHVGVDGQAAEDLDQDHVPAREP